MSEIKIGNKEYMKSAEMQAVAEKIVSDKSISIGDARIKYLLIYPYINKKTAGRCLKSSNEMKVFGQCEYIIEMSGELWDNLDDERKSILMYHELLHILVTTNKAGEFEYKLRDHDIKDFATIINTYGIDWFDNLKTIFSSVYDVEPADLDSFSV